MSSSILPANLADLERDLDAALARIGDVEIPISLLWDPWLCPLDVLPYLAWAVSVDMWRSDWAEQTKRRVVAGSLGLHRIKGTRPAVVRALQAIGVTADLTEWFEESPPARRGTFSLTAWANDNLSSGQRGFLSEALYDQLVAAVNNAKNTRSHFTFNVGAKFTPTPLATACSLDGAAVGRVDAVVQHQIRSGGGVVAGAAQQTAAVGRCEVRLGLDTELSPAKLAAGSGMSAVAVIRVCMEVRV